MRAGTGDGTADQIASRNSKPKPMLTVLLELHPAYHDALVRGHNVETGAGAADHACHIVEHGVRVLLVLEQLDVRVKQVALGDVDALVDLSGRAVGCDRRSPLSFITVISIVPDRVIVCVYVCICVRDCVCVTGGRRGWGREECVPTPSHATPTRKKSSWTVRPDARTEGRGS